MDPAGLESFVARARGLVDAAPPATRAETRTLLVEPLLETLGWDPRSATRRIDESVAGAALEYVLEVAETPALFVAVEAYPATLSEDREATLGRVMAETGVDRAIYTNGREVRLLAGRDPPERFACELEDLRESTAELEHVSRRRLADRLRRDSRDAAARRLAVERTTLESAVADELASVAGDAYRDEFREAARRFVKERIHRLAANPVSESTARPGATDRTASFGVGELDSSASGERDPRTESGQAQESSGPRSREHPPRESNAADGTEPEPTTGDAGGGSRTGDGGATSTGRARGDDPSEERADERSNDEDAGERSNDEDAGERSNDEGAGERSNDEGAGERSSGEDAADAADRDVDASSEERLENRSGGESDAAAANRDGPSTDAEYVVRFFNERGSIGAVGHSRPDGAMAAAAEYLFDRGLSGVRLPWRPEDDVVVLHTDPVLEDGTPMDEYARLSNGTFLNTGGSLARRAARIEALTRRAGLRAMLDGDWESDGEE